MEMAAKVGTELALSGLFRVVSILDENFRDVITTEELKHLNDFVDYKIVALTGEAKSNDLVQLMPLLEKLQAAALELEDLLDLYEYDQIEKQVNSSDSEPIIKEKALPKQVRNGLDKLLMIVKRVEKIRQSQAPYDSFIDFLVDYESKHDGPDGNNNGIKGVRPPSLVMPEVKPKETNIEAVFELTRSIASGGVHKAGPKARQARHSPRATPPEMVKGGNKMLLWATDILRPALGGEAKLRPFEKDVVNKGKEAVLDSCRGRVKRNIGEWIKGKQIGSGSFGTVYEAMNVTGDFFAVKEVSLCDQGGNAQQCISQLEQEIALLSQFEHENIVQYYGTDKKDAKLFIFIEYVAQGSLVSLYQKYRLQDSQVSAYTKQILKGLNYLHERDIVHRDIKGANILINADGTVKVADFGLAKQLSKLNGRTSCIGSAKWMAPEVVKPTKPYGPAADIWSLGCTVIEMLTQRLPFPDTDQLCVLYKVWKGEGPPIPDDLSEDARDFIVQCVQWNPASRPTASQLLEHPFVKRPLSIHSSPSC